MTHRHTPAYRHVANGGCIRLNVILHAEGIFWLGRMTYRRGTLGRSRSRWWELWCGVCVGRGGITGCWLVTHLDPRVVVPAMRNTHKYVTLVAMTRTKCNIIYTYLISSWALRYFTYHQTSNISCTLVGNIIVDHSDVVGASPIGAAPKKLYFQLNTWLQWTGQRQLQNKTRKHLSLRIWCHLY